MNKLRNNVSASGWRSLTLFEVYVNSVAAGAASLYANGRQQVRIDVRLQARDSSNVIVSLTADDLKNLKLIDAVTMSDLSSDTDYRSAHREKYEIYHGSYFAALQPSVESVDAPCLLSSDMASVIQSTGMGEVAEETSTADERDQGLGYQVVTYWLSTTNLQPRALAAHIHKGSDVIYTTASSTHDPVSGQFRSIVNIRPVRPISYTTADWVSRRVDTVVSNPDFDVDLYYTKIKNEIPKHYAMKFVGCIVDNIALDGWFYSIRKSDRNKIHYFYEPTPPRQILYTSIGEPHRVVRFRVNDYTAVGEVTSARIIDVSAHQYGRGDVLSVFPIDSQGNKHHLKLQVTSDGNGHFPVA
ncbi:hypothetical protein IFT80_16510 [Pseudomonas sp. CFBP 8771]|uniref:hypothetical protein n=1 Tax=Pseudomonas sp. CFBP 8771 TaxID=2775285 RepID=UPI00177F2018|nr:hypothetical protein [Pseudomonas sp. CFBP 8771]MBD8604245.1 hypothetical protein [Pseudomonas sp. CFBP 8771]